MYVYYDKKFQGCEPGNKQCNGNKAKVFQLKRLP